mmetsp:Transcript_13958/g.34897  ORF Transcript_13958/g.34897 Transcript_13958/m.34897 type:complete len:136 (-) Transcript_13958:138-545(-)
MASMTSEARQLLELLRPAVEQAEQVGVQQQQLLQQHVASAETFFSLIAETTRVAAQERDRLLEARNEFASLREAEVGKGREEAQAIVAAAREEEAQARARTSAERTLVVRRSPAPLTCAPPPSTTCVARSSTAST